MKLQQHGPPSSFSTNTKKAPAKNVSTTAHNGKGQIVTMNQSSTETGTGAG